MRLLIPVVSCLLFACNGGDTNDTDVADTDADTDVTPACDTITEGSWDASGSCFGMSMSADLTLGEDGCSFTLDNWNMNMSTPDGGTISGSDVTMTGDNWDDCTGTLDGDQIEGTCTDGCVFTMELAN